MEPSTTNHGPRGTMLPPTVLPPPQPPLSGASAATAGAGTAGDNITIATSTSASTGTATTNNKNNNKESYLWNMNVQEIQTWIRGMKTFFPKDPRLLLYSATASNTAPNPSNPNHHHVGGGGGINAISSVPTALQMETYQKEMMIAQTLCNNLVTSLLSASVEPCNESTNNHKRLKLDPNNNGIPSSSTSSSSPPGTNPNSASTSLQHRDMYNILDPSFLSGKHVVHIPGSILIRLTQGGLINALAGTIGGIVDPITSKPIPPHTNDSLIHIPNPHIHNNNNNNNNTPTTTIQILRNKQVKILTRAITARLERDMMDSTPSKIVSMLCPEISTQEIVGIRKRIFDTVFLGKGTNASAQAVLAEGAEDLPVAARIALHDVDKFKKCKVCGNNEQSSFILDQKNGDLICKNCGTVATESLMHEGSQFRKFEGEEDRNHHGVVANPLYSNVYNMSTNLGGMSMQVGAGMGGFGSSGGGKKGLENVLRNTHAYIEMNISQFGKDEKKTRTGYKDRQKRDAFGKINHVGDALSLHQAVLQRAKELFAAFRDDRELVHQFKGVVAACLCEAFDQLSKEGKQILKSRAGENDDDDDGNLQNDLNSVTDTKSNARATRRTELHSSSMAGKGGLLLNPPNKDQHSDDVLQNVKSSFEEKIASSWDLDSCRSWLLQASNSIAQQWSDRGINGKASTESMSEMEGRLVQHTLTICNMLENELSNLNNAKNKNSIQGGNRHRVKTPRVSEMGQLGIKWQNAHERGSGGAGGVGNSGSRRGGHLSSSSSSQNPQSNNNNNNNRRTAGQILILKNAKKLGEVINDQVAADAIHRELRALLGRQEAKRKKERSDQSALKRFNQMKRKPWLQARVES